MFESEEQRKRAELIITLLAKLYVVLELSVDSCPVCHKALSHDSECPISLAWSLLSEDQQRDARTAIRALALSIGTDDSVADPMVH
jgi:predicted nucleic acid-binding Zn ribbon protein